MRYNVIANGFANLLVKRCRFSFWLRRRQLKKTQWRSSDELRQLQLKLLQRLVYHCYHTVPYYRKLMNDRGIRVEDIKTLEDIERFPILTRQDVLQAGDSIVSQKYPRWMTRVAYTGGTTGTVMRLQRDMFSIANEHAFVRRQWDWAGIRFKDRCAYLTGRLVAEPDQTDHLHAYDPFMKELILSTYHLSPETAKIYAQTIKEYGAKAIAGYPSAVHLLARICVDAHIELTLQAALTSSETLTESMRKTIEQAFNCKVFDFYGSAERVCYIFTCEHGRYHIIPEYGLTELIPVDRSDESRCAVVSTGFWNVAMPLVRYRTGDILIESNERCPCAREFQVVKTICGRAADVIKTPSGREFGAAILTHLLYGTNHVAESQIIQDGLDHVVIEYVPSRRFSESDLASFKNLITQHLPTELKVDLRRVEAVQRTVAGKVKPVVSQMAS